MADIRSLLASRSRRSRSAALAAALTTALALGMFSAWWVGSAGAGPTCTVTWVGGVNGSWQTAGNWSPARVPLSTDDVCVTATTGSTPAAVADTYTVTLSGSVTVDSLTLGGTSGTQTLVVQSNGSTLALSTASSIGVNGVLALGDAADGSSAVLSGQSSVLSNNGNLDVVRNGYIRTGVVNNATVEVSGAGLGDGAGGAVAITNNSSLTVDAAGSLALSGNTAITNAGGTIANNGSLSQSGGTFTERAGATTGNPILLSSATLDDDTTAGSGSWNVSGNGTLTGSGTHPGVAMGQTVNILSNGSTETLGVDLANNGTIAVGDATNLSAAVLGGPARALTNSGTIETFHAGTGYLRTNITNNGTIDLAGATNEDGAGGATTLTNNATFTVETTGTYTGSGATNFSNLGGSVANHGSATLSGGTFTERAGTETNNPFVLSGASLDDDTTAGGGKWNVTGNGTLTGTGTSPGVASGQTVTIGSNGSQLAVATNVTNAGTINVGDATNASTASLAGPTVTVTNSGTIASVHSGTALLRTNIINNATVDLAGTTNEDGAGGATTLTNNGTLTVESTGTFTGTGATSVSNTSGTITNLGSASLSGGTFTERGGSETGNPFLLSSAALDADTSAAAGAWNVSGNGTLTGTGTHPGIASGQTVTVLSNGSQLTVTKNLADAGTIVLGDPGHGSSAVLAGPTVTVTVTASGALDSVGPGTGYVRIAVDNLGTTDLAAPSNNQDGSGGATLFTNEGSFMVESGAAYSVSGASGVANTAGTITNHGSFTQSGGTFTERGGATAGSPILISSATLDDDTTAAAGSWSINGNGTLTGTGLTPGIASGQTVTVLSNGSQLALAKSLANAGTIVLGDAGHGSNAVLAGPSVTVTSTGTLDSVTPGTAYVRTNFDNQGTVDLAAASNSQDGSGGATTFTNEGLFTVESGAAYTVSGASGVANTAGTIANHGAFTQSGGSFTERGGATTGTPIVISGASLDDDTASGGGAWNISGSSTLTGSASSPGTASGQTVTILGNGSQLNLAKDVTNGGHLNIGDPTDNGSAILAGPVHTMTNTGTLSVPGPSSAYIRTNVINTGTTTLAISPSIDGAGGAVTFTNDGLLTIPAGVTLPTTGGSSFAQGSTGTLDTTVTIADGHLGTITGSGGVHLNGTLQVTTVGSATVGTQYVVVNDGSTNGTQFSSYSFGAQPYTVLYTSTQVIITVAAPLAITTTTLPGGTVGTPYTAPTLASTGGTGAVTWSVPSADLPPGVTLSSAGAFGGTPTATGSYTFTVTATDSGVPAQVQTQQLTILVGAPPLVATPITLPAGQVGTVYPGATLGVTGGLGAYHWSISIGSLPAGLSLDASTGAISGTPTGPPGLVSFTARVADSETSPQAVTEPLSINVAPATLVVTTTSLPGGQVNTPYTGATLAFSGGTPTVTWSVTSGALPAGLSLNGSTGAISGTPTGPPGTSSFQVTAHDSGSPAQNANAQLSIQVLAAPLAITTTTLTGGQIGTVYPGSTLASTGGTGSVTWAQTGLPAGLSLNSATGAITGTPTGPSGPFTVEVTATDSAVPMPQSVSANVSITIAPATLVVTTASLPGGQVGSVYAGATLAASGGTGADTWAQTGLPAGLTLNPTTGAITGTPTGPATTASVQVTATDSGTPTPQTASATIPLVVDAQPTSTGLGTSASTVTAGQPVTFTATVSPSTVTGTVSFTVDSSPLGTTPVSGGTATLTTSSLAAGSHQIVATYNGDSSHLSSQSAPLTEQVNPAANTTITTLSFGTGPQLVTVPFVAVVAPVSGGGTPTGTVTLMNNGVAITSGQLTVVNGVDQVSFTMPANTVCPCSATAVYAGDPTFAGSTSNALTPNYINGLTTTPDGYSRFNPANPGTPVTIGGGVTGPLAALFLGLFSPITGTFTYTSGPNVLGTVSMNGSGAGQIVVTFPAAGSYPIVGTYSGNWVWPGSTGTIVTETIVNGLIPTSLPTLTVSPNRFPSTQPVVHGRPARFTVTGTGTNGATGVITISLVQPAGPVLCTIPVAQTISTLGGSCTATINLPAGTYIVQASYPGDAAHLPSTSPLAQLHVTKAATTIAATAAPTVARRGTAVTLRATGLPADATGTIVFSSGARVLCTGVVASGMASCRTPTNLPPRNYPVSATYSGDGGYIGSTASTTFRLS